MVCYWVDEIGIDLEWIGICGFLVGGEMVGLIMIFEECIYELVDKVDEVDC